MTKKREHFFTALELSLYSNATCCARRPLLVWCAYYMCAAPILLSRRVEALCSHACPPVGGDAAYVKCGALCHQQVGAVLLWHYGYQDLLYMCESVHEYQWYLNIVSWIPMCLHVCVFTCREYCIEMWLENGFRFDFFVFPTLIYSITQQDTY